MRTAEQVADGEDSVLCVCSNCERKWIMLITKQVRRGQLNAVRSRDAEIAKEIRRILVSSKSSEMPVDTAFGFVELYELCEKLEKVKI